MPLQQRRERGSKRNGSREISRETGIQNRKYQGKSERVEGKRVKIGGLGMGTILKAEIK
jgi:hypothetical protein